MRPRITCDGRAEADRHVRRLLEAADGSIFYNVNRIGLWLRRRCQAVIPGKDADRGADAHFTLLSFGVE
jgi:hypothetical protein